MGAIMKKRILGGLVVVLLFAVVLLAGCSKGKFEDGFYFAQQDSFDESSGWKSIVMFDVENGNIVDVTWTAASRTAGTDKVARSASGQYGMVARGGAQAEWDVQAQRMEQDLLDTQDPTGYTLDAEGHTDAVSGVSIHVSDFLDLVNQALAAGPTERGPYKDGAYSAEAADFENGWKDRVDITVVGGRIVAAYWDPFDEEGRDKNVVSAEGGYPMVENGGAQSPWHVQAELMDEALLETQDPAAIALNDSGGTDAVSGVSIHVGAFIELAEKALEDAR